MTDNEETQEALDQAKIEGYEANPDLMFRLLKEMLEIKNELLEVKVEKLTTEVTYQTNTRKFYEGALKRANERTEKAERERDDALAEVERWRGVVERVEALADEPSYVDAWNEEAITADDLRDALNGPEQEADDAY